MLCKFLNFNTIDVTNRPPKRTRAFGLVELMVSISIMTLVSTIILVKNRSFNNALLIRNQAYELAFSLRQAQLLAVSGTREVDANSNQFGIHFDVSAAANNHRYRTFRDDGNNPGWYDGSDVTLGTLGSLDSRYMIDITNSAGTPIAANNLSITFVRPNFDALFRTAAGTSASGPMYLKVSPKDSATPFRLVEITNTGQITVK